LIDDGIHIIVEERDMLELNYGIGAQALAVQAYLEGNDGLEVSWSDEHKNFLANVQCAPWYNGRERGIVVYLRSMQADRQINFAVFEHRCSDQICVVMFEAITWNPPTIRDVPAEQYSEDYWVTKEFQWGHPADCADWIISRLTDFWIDCTQEQAA